MVIPGTGYPFGNLCASGLTPPVIYQFGNWRDNDPMIVSEIRRKNLQWLVEQNGGVTAFAAMVDRDKSSVSRWIADKNVGNALARHIEICLDRPEGWLDRPQWPEGEDVEEPLPLVEVKVWNAKAAAGHGYDNSDAAQIGTIFFRPRSLEKKGIQPSQAHVFYVHGDSMLPRLRNGDSILFDGTKREVRDGRVYVIRWGDETLVKRLYRELDGAIRVTSDNPDPQYRDRLVSPEDPNFEVLGRVCWVGSWEE